MSVAALTLSYIFDFFTLDALNQSADQNQVDYSRVSFQKIFKILSFTLRHTNTSMFHIHRAAGSKQHVIGLFCVMVSHMMPSLILQVKQVKK